MKDIVMAPAFCTTRQWVLVGVLFLAVFHTVEVSPLPFPGRDKCLNSKFSPTSTLSIHLTIRAVQNFGMEMSQPGLWNFQPLLHS